MKYIVDLPEEVVEKANPFEGEIGLALHDAIYLDSFIEAIKGEISRSKTDHELQIAENDIKGKLMISDLFCEFIKILDKHMGKENG